MSDKSKRPRRPPGVTLAGWLHLLQCLLLLTTGGLLLRDTGVLFSPAGQLDLELLRLVREAGTGGVFVALSLPALVVALGLFFLRSWAWLLGITMQGLVLASALIAYVLGNPQYVLMVMGVLLVLSLNQQDVRQAFRSQERS